MSAAAVRSQGMLFIETSAKTSSNVSAIFETVALKLAPPAVLPESRGSDAIES
jgi:hypothetical protein